MFMGLSGFRYLVLMRKGRGGGGGGGRKGKREKTEEGGREDKEEVEEEGRVRMGFSYNYSGPPRD